MSDASRETLHGARSPFLKHGATQPVQWMPWGAAAFERAAREDKAILLDIGAVWCHWCHVMDRESYENPAIAARINELFVPVKVDRDERPDVDARYQRAVQALSGQGGWPLTAFLTPDGEVFYGGTYFPPDDRYGRPGLPRVLEEIARVWREDRERAREAATSILSRIAEFEESRTAPGDVPAALVHTAVEAFARLFDFRWGGFGSAPKFPNAGALNLLLDEHLDGAPDWARKIVEDTLIAMARGGVYDQLGGGFHRYSVDERWVVPHFEKMAYDNGVLLEVYARAAAVFDDREIAAAAHGIVDSYFELAPELLERGGFPASQDADITDEDDGDYWTWTGAELRAALGSEELARIAEHHFGFHEDVGGMHIDPRRRVLWRARSAAEVAARLGSAEDEISARLPEIVAALKAVRDTRPRPYVDESVFIGWNGLLASGFLAAARHLGRADAGGAALRALERIWEEGRAGVVLVHRLGDAERGFLEDQVHYASAAIDAFEYTGEEKWLERAGALLDAVLAHYADPETGALGDRLAGDAAVVAALDRPHRPILDSPEPSGNAVAALALQRYALLSGAERYAEAAQRVLRAFAANAPQLATAAATYVCAVAWATRASSTLIVVAQEDDALWHAGRSAYRPRTVVRRCAPGSVDRATLPPEIRAMVTGDAPRAYLCAGKVCAPPVAETEALEELMRGFRGE